MRVCACVCVYVVCVHAHMCVYMCVHVLMCVHVCTHAHMCIHKPGPGALTLPCLSAEEGLLYRARYFGDTDMYHRAQKMGTPSCSRLSEVQASLHG